MVDPGEPDHHVEHLWPAYLGFYREAIATAVLALPQEERRRTRLPSGWTPIELLSHVLHMEQRWFVWGFLGGKVDAVWGDWSRDEPWDESKDETEGEPRWQVPADVTAEDLAERLRAVGRRTTRVLATVPLGTVAEDGERFDGDPATLEWICFHVLQEYARHAGHLDIAVELSERPG